MNPAQRGPDSEVIYVAAPNAGSKATAIHISGRQSRQKRQGRRTQRVYRRSVKRGQQTEVFVGVSISFQKMAVVCIFGLIRHARRTRKRTIQRKFARTLQQRGKIPVTSHKSWKPSHKGDVLFRLLAPNPNRRCYT